MQSSTDISIVSACADDAEDIVGLLSQNVAKQSVLPRKTEEIRQNIQFFKVARNNSKTIGCVSLKYYGDGLFEIRSLVVDQEFEGRGIGSKLLQTILEVAVQAKATEVFTLTIRPNLFKRLGFTVVSKERFNQKVWNDCACCPKKDTCDEIALSLTIS